MSGSFELVIFDCDGVLVDSERVANDVFARALREVCGLEFTLEQMFGTFVGHSKAQCLAKIEAILGHAPPAELERRYREEINAALEASVQAVTGIEQVLAEMRRIEAQYSPYIEESELSRLNREAGQGWVTTTAEMVDLLVKSSQISRLTGGAFDITYASVGRYYDYREGERPDVGGRSVRPGPGAGPFSRPFHKS